MFKAPGFNGAVDLITFGGLHARMQKTRSWSAITQRITPWLVIFSGVDDNTRSSNEEYSSYKHFSVGIG